MFSPQIKIIISPQLVEQAALKSQLRKEREYIFFSKKLYLMLKVIRLGLEDSSLNVVPSYVAIFTRLDSKREHSKASFDYVPLQI